jgi:hypothetical protein
MPRGRFQQTEVSDDLIRITRHRLQSSLRELLHSKTDRQCQQICFLPSEHGSYGHSEKY